MSTLKEMAFLLVGALAPAAIAVFLHPQLADREHAGLKPLEIRLESTASWESPVLWVDARDKKAFEQRTVPGAVHFEFDRFDQAIGELLLAWTPEKRVIVFCNSTSCETSELIAARLREAGLDEVYFLHGGWDAWLAAN